MWVVRRRSEASRMSKRARVRGGNGAGAREGRRRDGREMVGLGRFDPEKGSELPPSVRESVCESEGYKYK